MLDRAKKEFEYWYPVDIRVSAKELVKNHLTMFLYGHCGVFKDQPDRWPRSIFVNGFIKIDGKKMSKSKGIFKLLREGVDEYSADALRMTLADGGDSQEDGNFDCLVAEKNVSRISNYLKWCEEMMMKKKSEEVMFFRNDDAEEGSPEEFFDHYFEAKMMENVNMTIEAYEKMRFRDVLKFGFHEMEIAKNWYEHQISCTNRSSKRRIKMKKSLVEKFIETITLLVAPIIPHTCEFIWQEILGHGQTSSVTSQKFPEKSEEFSAKMMKFLEIGRYYNTTMHRFQQMKNQDVKEKFGSRKKKDEIPNKKVKEVTIYLCSEFEPWQVKCLKVLKTLFVESGETSFECFMKKGEITKRIRSEFPGVSGKSVGSLMKFTFTKIREIEMEWKKRESEMNENINVKKKWVHQFFETDSKSSFDEVKFWNEIFVQERMKVEVLKLKVSDKAGKVNIKLKKELSQEEMEVMGSKKFENCVPLKPQISCFFY